MVIEATIAGPRKIARAAVSFRVDERFGDLPLQPTGPNTYRATVPAARTICSHDSTAFVS